jgi:murein DD-endopeptidase MepM/ murein hydrolase activator NlpD
MADYAEFLEATMPSRWEALSAAISASSQKAASAKSVGAPTVMGAGGGGQSISAIKLANMKNFKTAGNKTLPVKGPLTQGRGASNIKYGAGHHTGLDFGVPKGTTVRAAGNGIVTRIGGEGAYGNSVHIRHPDGTTSLYGHLSGSGVKVGQKVKAGQAIARSGNTGRTTGAHLHFELRSRDSYGGDINPYGWLQKR